MKKLSVAIVSVLGAPSAFAAEPLDVAINEVAWMGTTYSAYDEWIELRNNTGSAVDLSGWTLNSTDGTPAIVLSGSVAAGGVFLLERTDDTSVPDVAADQIYTGALSNTVEYLELRDNSGNLIDEVDAWYAGDSDLDAAVERVDPTRPGIEPTNWATAVNDYGVGFGTPRAENSAYSGDGSSGGSAACDYPQTLEVVSVNIGQGDATLVATPTGLLLADAGESYWNSHLDAAKIADTIHARYGDSCNYIDYVVVSHIHLDHIGYIQIGEDEDGNILDEDGKRYKEGENVYMPDFMAGLAHLVQELGFEVGTTLLRDFVTHNPNKDPADGGSKTYRNWRAYLLSPDGQAAFNPQTAVLGSSQVDLGSVGGNPVVVDIIAVDGATPSNPDGCDPATYFGGAEYLLRGDRSADPVPPSENDLSVSFVVSLGDFQVYIGGDTSGENYESEWGYRYHDVESCMADDPILQQKYADRLEFMRMNHHGSSHSSNQAFLDFFSPQVSVFSVGDNNTYSHVDPAVLDRTLVESEVDRYGEVLMTESGANVASPADACHSGMPSVCAEVADGEFPGSTESDEAGDAGVVVVVDPDGSGFTVQGDPAITARHYGTF